MQRAERGVGGDVRSGHRRRTGALYRGMQLANRRFQNRCGKAGGHDGGRSNLTTIHQVVETQR